MSMRGKSVQLGEVIKQRKQFITIDDAVMYSRPTVKLHAQGILLRDRVLGASIKTKKQQVCRADEFLVAEIDAKAGGFGIVPKDLDGSLVSSHYFLYQLDSTLLLPQFLELVLKTKEFRRQVEAQGTTNYAAIKARDVYGYTIPLPAVEEQKQIVSKIYTIQRKLQAADELRTCVKGKFGSLFLSLHGATGTQCKLGDLLELHEDMVRIQPSQAYPQVGIRGFGGGLFSKKAISGTETTYKVFNRLYEDAIVLSQVKGWEGAITVCPKMLSGMYVSPEYRTFICKPNIANPTYMQEVVHSPWFWKYLQEATRGVGARRERVRPEKFLGIELHMPSFERQNSIVAILNTLKGARQIHTEIQSSIDAVMPSALQKVFEQLR